MSRAQVIRPAGAGHETLYVLLAAMLIVLLAAAVVSLRGERDDEVTLASHEIDARRDLTPAEQGLHSDLQVAADEIVLLREDGAAQVEVATLAEEGLPPFVDDASSQSRGRHQWQRLSGDAYFGRSQAPAVAGNLLLIVPGRAGASADLWLNRSEALAAPADLSQEALVASGWRHVVSHFDAGVTRQHRH
ncbi:DUF6162 family protein [Pseudomonas cremoricolorata]|uniref:DUF6162 family protein n=1 Tax=Pseudomonas cremoricolorata TaxID=157783 RepID=UPI0004236472|nr:DUF6162 family protein [Pseudomonas cremoricolorata]